MENINTVSRSLKSMRLIKFETIPIQNLRGIIQGASWGSYREIEGIKNRSDFDVLCEYVTDSEW